MKSEVQPEAGDPAAPSPQPASSSRGRAGRNLPAAIGVGVTLAVLLFVTLFTVRILWIGVICLFVGGGAFELATALSASGRRVPRIPVGVAGAVIPAIAYAQGSNGLLLAFFISVVVCLAWRGYDPHEGEALRDLPATIFTLAYTGLLGGFAALLSQPADGPRRIIIFIGTVVANDIGGYTAGVLSGGKHKLAPSISPGKSWEGLGGSVLAGGLCSGLCFPLLLHHNVLLGIVIGLAIVASSTLGDLAESMLKRDMGIKDMSHLLPGHGGVMDRLDSLLASAPVAYLLLTAWAPLP